MVRRPIAFDGKDGSTWLSSILTAAETAFKNGDTVGGAAQLLLFQDALDTFLGTGGITQIQHDAWDADAAEIINAVT
jgi:hypothetical protein